MVLLLYTHILPIQHITLGSTIIGIHTNINN